MGETVAYMLAVQVFVAANAVHFDARVTIDFVHCRWLKRPVASAPKALQRVFHGGGWDSLM